MKLQDRQLTHCIFQDSGFLKSSDFFKLTPFHLLSCWTPSHVKISGCDLHSCSLVEPSFLLFLQRFLRPCYEGTTVPSFITLILMGTSTSFTARGSLPNLERCLFCRDSDFLSAHQRGRLCVVPSVISRHI